jgi:hypothetical protein
MNAGIGAGGYSEKGGNVLKNFREVAMRGNAVDMAVGIIIGAALTGSDARRKFLRPCRQPKNVPIASRSSIAGLSAALIVLLN